MSKYTTSSAQTFVAEVRSQHDPLYEAGYSAGLAAGQKRERRALRAWLDRLWLTQDRVYVDTVINWLASRAKKRQTGGRDA